MAGTYGAAGTNPYTIPGIGGILSNEVNAKSGITQVYRGGALTTQQSIGTYNPQTKKFTPDTNANLTNAEIKSLSSPEGIKAITTAATQTAQKAGAANSQQLLSPNTATTSPNADGSQGRSLTPTEAAAGQEENKYKENTRAGDTAYGTDLKYPLNLKSEVQDVIKFSILEYSPSLAKENQSTTNGQFGSGKKRIVTLESSGIPIVAGSKRIGVITLPIPAGISDGNTVGWSNDELTAVGQALGNLAKGFFEGGVEGASAAASNEINNATAASDSGDLQTKLKGYFTSQAAQGANFTGRAYGAAANNNLELLFSNPNLRSFAFTFSFYPRSESEAVMVRRIIRAFKQSMSVKRSKTSLLLKAPHTFAISYVTAGGKAQPYLNSFKECALTSCSVDYTPDGTYMTYGGKEKSMTAYRLSLQFQELEPIFDDEYYDIDKNKDTSIGF